MTDALDLIEQAITKGLRDFCVRRNGECYAYVDDNPNSQEPWVAEVDGEFNVESLAEAVLHALREAGLLAEWQRINDDTPKKGEILLAYPQSDEFIATVKTGKWGGYGFPSHRGREPIAWQPLLTPPLKETDDAE